MTGIERVAALQFPLQADFRMPGSKSHANRAIICACLAEGRTVIRNATPCDDVAVMVKNLQLMGFRLRWTDLSAGELTIDGGLPEAKNTKTFLDCHNAGTTLRFLVSLACVLPGEWVLTGDEHMRRRPISDLVAALRLLGADISDTAGCPPVTIIGGRTLLDAVRMKADVSSQYLTSLLLIAPMLPSGLTVELEGTLASSGYIDLTEKTMKDFGVCIERKNSIFIVRHGAYRPVASYDIEGDWSAAGAWLVLGLLSGSRFDFMNLSPISEQADSRLPGVLKSLMAAGDKTVDVTELPDQLMNLALFAAFCKGKTVFTGAANLRRKECDRLAVITSELGKGGVAITEQPDGVTVQGGDVRITRSVTLDPHMDHRMAMCFAVLGLLRGNISVKDPDCVAKSYPDFFREVQAVRSQSRPIAIVGMRGAGKSNLARRLASRIELQCVDVDKAIEAAHGPIKEFVAVQGWPAFRAIEEQMVETLLKPGTVVSLGGGATESAKTRLLLKKKAVVIWIQASKEELIKRLESGKRPSITGLPLAEEVQKLMEDRGPHYREVAHASIASSVPFSRQVPTAVKSLQAMVRPSF